MAISSKSLALNRKRNASATILAVFACAAIAGCAVGPNFQKPGSPAVSGYTAGPLSDTAGRPGVSGGEAQLFDTGKDIPGDWWTLFHSPQLNALVERSLAANHDLKATQAALAVAHQNVLAQRGAFYPAVSLGLSASRQRQSGALAPTPIDNAFTYSLFTPQVSVSYMPDVFGLNRRGAEAIKAQEQAARFSEIAARNQVLSDVDQAWVAYTQSKSLAERYSSHYLDEATDVLQIAQFAYEHGGIALIDYLDALRDSRSTTADALAAYTQTWQAIHQLSYVTASEVAP